PTRTPPPPRPPLFPYTTLFRSPLPHRRRRRRPTVSPPTSRRRLPASDAGRSGRSARASNLRREALSVVPRGSRGDGERRLRDVRDRKSIRLNSSHRTISYAVFC